MFEQAVLPVEDPERFGLVRKAIESSFSSGNIARFLGAIDRASLRIRDFEDVLRKKILGEPALSEYARLSNGDQGQIRELYLVSLERVDPELRRRFYRIYAYY